MPDCSKDEPMKMFEIDATMIAIQAPPRTVPYFKRAPRGAINAAPAVTAKMAVVPPSASGIAIGFTANMPPRSGAIPHPWRPTNVPKSALRYVGECVCGLDFMRSIIGTKEPKIGINPPIGNAHANPVVIATADDAVASAMPEPAVLITFATCCRVGLSLRASICVSPVWPEFADTAAIRSATSCSCSSC